MFKLKFIWSKLKGKRTLFILGMILTIITSFVGLINPALSKFLVDNIIRNKNHKLLIPMVIIMIAVVIIKNALHLLKVYFMEKSSQHMLYNIRMRIFKNIQYQEMDYFEHISTGDIITRLNGDLEFIRHFVAYTTYCYVEMFFIFIAATVFMNQPLPSLPPSARESMIVAATSSLSQGTVVISRQRALYSSSFVTRPPAAPEGHLSSS